jgi:hypothetical protein
MDVVSHEFFHVVTPLTIHSKIQDFDYNDPKIRTFGCMKDNRIFCQPISSETGFNGRDYAVWLSDQIERASAMNDTMSFTKWVKPCVEQPQDQYVCIKRALIGMCIDII